MDKTGCVTRLGPTLHQPAGGGIVKLYLGYGWLANWVDWLAGQSGLLSAVCRPPDQFPLDNRAQADLPGLGAAAVVVEPGWGCSSLVLPGTIFSFSPHWDHTGTTPPPGKSYVLARLLDSTGGNNWRITGALLQTSF